jgi:twitching motility protein PilT
MAVSDTPPVDSHVTIKKPEKEPEINKYFRAVVRTQASDLHLKADTVPRIRTAGTIKATSAGILSNEDIERMMFEIMTPAQQEYYVQHGACDFAHDLDGSDRFRINVFRQRSLTSVSARRVTRYIPSFEELHLPIQMKDLCHLQQGMIILAGITGAGKSTSIAAMIQHINHMRACHVVTVEDPIEYLFEDDKAFINQREIGIDVRNFEDALRYLMREDPDVVLIGEMRDRETFQAALNAAETGHLVFCTVHSSSTAQTITRILDLFPEEGRELIRQSLSFNLRAIICQKLLPSIKPGVDRVPTVEIMLVNPSIRLLIETHRETEILDVVRASLGDGMQDFTEHLRTLVEAEFIDHKTAYEAAPNPEELRMRLKGIRTGGGSILA